MTKVIKKKNYELKGFGFPVLLAEVELVASGDDYYSRIDSRKIQGIVFDTLRHARCQVTGAQLIFIRKYMEMTQTELAKALGLAGHTTISQWESSGADVPKGFDALYLAAQRALMAKYRGEAVLDLAAFTPAIGEKPGPPQPVLAISA